MELNSFFVVVSQKATLYDRIASSLHHYVHVIVSQ